MTVETFNVELAGAARAYTYDRNGNRVQKTEGGVIWNYSWDAENRLVKVQRSERNVPGTNETKFVPKFFGIEKRFFVLN